MLFRSAGVYSFDVFIEDINSNFSNVATVSISVNGPDPVPEPGTLLLLITGLVAARITDHHRRKKVGETEKSFLLQESRED